MAFDWGSMLYDLAGGIPIFGSIIQTACDISQGKYEIEDAVTTAVDAANELSDISDKQMVTYSEQYEVPLSTMKSLRTQLASYLNQVANNQVIAGDALNKLVSLSEEIQNHEGRQKLELRNAKDTTKADYQIANEKVLAANANANKLQAKIDTLQDISSRATNSVNDSAIKDVEQQYGVKVNRVTADIKQKEI